MALFDTTAGGLPLLIDVAIDANTGLPLEENGRPVLVTGQQALRQWVHFALARESRRFAYAAHTADYGNEFETLAGYPAVEVESRLPEMIRQALEVNPYITATTGLTVRRKEAGFAVGFVLETVYGTMEYEGEVICA